MIPPSDGTHEYPAIILAAGDSIRMGRPKALLPRGATTFLGSLCAVFRESGAPEVAVVVGGRHADEVAAEARRCGARIIRNEDPGSGPITSVRRATESASPDAPGLIFHPVDIPGVQASDVTALTHAALEDPDSDAFVASVNRRGGHPLLVRRSLFASILEGEHESMRMVLRSPGVSRRFVALENESLLQDFDTPDDLRSEPAP